MINLGNNLGYLVMTQMNLIYSRVEIAADARHEA